MLQKRILIKIECDERNLQAWAALDKHYQAMKDVHMRSLFEREPSRFDQFSMQVGDILLDYSKNRATPETMQLLTALAAEAGVCEKRDAMFSGMLPPEDRVDGSAAATRRFVWCGKKAGFSLKCIGRLILMRNAIRGHVIFHATLWGRTWASLVVCVCVCPRALA